VSRRKLAEGADRLADFYRDAKPATKPATCNDDDAQRADTKDGIAPA
jgi:hypothetical protein